MSAPKYTSRRSPFLSTHFSISTSQPLATSIGYQILQNKGTNAIDASIAIAAALCVLEPCSTGLGGDMFALYYKKDENKVFAVNGSGKSPSGLNLDVVRQRDGGDGENENDEVINGISVTKFRTSPHAVTVPGAAAGWEDLYNEYGSKIMSFEELLEPAARLAEEGFPVSPVTSHYWRKGMSVIRQWVDDDDDDGGVPLTVDGKNGPKGGDLMHNPDMARVLRDLGKFGAKDGFYRGETGKAIVEVLKKHGGVMSMEDLEEHCTTFPEAISMEYAGKRLWQVPPNGQGVAGLIALCGLSELEDKGLLKGDSSSDGDCWSKTLHGMIETMRLGFHDARSHVADSDVSHNGGCALNSSGNCWSAETLHGMIEMMRLGFHDARSHVADPDGSQTVTNEYLLDKKRIKDRALKLFNPNKAVVQGEPIPSSCTVSFQVVDAHGNAVSFVNSNFQGFGTGIVPSKCGFTLQNRGFGFSLQPEHPNALRPSRRCYHTIIPAILTHDDTGEFYATFTNMGAYMQPQGHLQLTVALLKAKLDPQAAIDLPRFCIADGTKNGTVHLEEGFPPEILDRLKQLGHHDIITDVSGYDRSVFGRAQIIVSDRETGVLWAGSDGRCDGCAMGF